MQDDFQNIDLAAYIDRVQEAFDRHCEEIDQRTTEKLQAIPEDDVQSKEKILVEQQAELDNTLSELKQILSKKTKDYREELEKEGQKKMEEEFDLDNQLQGL